MANALEEIVHAHRIPQDRLGSLAALLMDDLVPATRRRVTEEQRALTVETWRSSAVQIASRDESGEIADALPGEDDIPTLDITAPRDEPQVGELSVHSADILAARPANTIIGTPGPVDARKVHGEPEDPEQ